MVSIGGGCRLVLFREWVWAFRTCSVARSPVPQFADLCLGDALEHCPAVHQILTPSGRCRNVDGRDFAAVSAHTSKHERLLRRSVSLHPHSSWALHACPSLGLDDRRPNTALVSVLPWSREDSRATRRAYVESRRARALTIATSRGEHPCARNSGAVRRAACHL